MFGCPAECRPVAVGSVVDQHRTTGANATKLYCNLLKQSSMKTKQDSGQEELAVFCLALKLGMVLQAPQERLIIEVAVIHSSLTGLLEQSQVRVMLLFEACCGTLV